MSAIKSAIHFSKNFYLKKPQCSKDFRNHEKTMTSILLARSAAPERNAEVTKPPTKPAPVPTFTYSSMPLDLLQQYLSFPIYVGQALGFRVFFGLTNSLHLD